MAMTPMALDSQERTGSPLGSHSCAASHPMPRGIDCATAWPASGLTRESRGASRVATPTEGLGLASQPASWASAQEIRWPAASTVREGLGLQPPNPFSSPPPGATTHAADGSSSAKEDERRPDADRGAVSPSREAPPPRFSVAFMATQP